MRLLADVLAVAWFEGRLARRMVRTWVLGVLLAIFGLVAGGYYGALHRFLSGFTGPAGYLSRDLPIVMSSMAAGGLTALVGIFYVFDWRHRDRAVSFAPTYDATALGPIAYALGKFIGLAVPLLVPFAVAQLGVLAMLLGLGVPVAPSTLVVGWLWVGVLPALGLVAMAFGLAGATGSRAVAIVVPLAYLGASFAVAFKLPEWAAALVGGMLEIPLHSKFIGYELSSVFWWQRLGGAALIAFFVLLGACGRFAVARSRGMQARALATGVAGVLWALTLVGVHLAYQRQGDLRTEVIEIERELADEPVPVVTRRDLKVTLRPDDRRLEGRSALALVNATDRPLRRLVLRLNAGQEVESVAVDGRQVEHERRRNALLVPLANPLAPGGAVELEVAHAGTIEAWAIDADVVLSIRELGAQVRGNRRFLGTLPAAVRPGCVVLGVDAGWYPEPGVAFGHEYPARAPVSLAPGRLEVELPPGWVAASAGRRTVDGNRQVFETDVPVPGLSLNAGPYAEIEAPVGDTLVRVLHHRDHHHNVDFFREAGAELVAKGEQAFQELEARTGLRYPHPELTIVEVPQQLSAYGSGWDAPSRLAAPGVVMLREGGVFGARFEQPLKTARGKFDKETGRESGKGLRVKVSVGPEGADEEPAAEPEPQEPAAPEGGASEAGSDGEKPADGPDGTDGQAAEEALEEFDEARAKADLLARFVRTDWTGGDVERLAFQSCWRHRIRTEDAAAPLLDFALSNYQAELGLGRAPFDHPALVTLLNSPNMGAVINSTIRGGDVTQAVISGITDLDRVYETILETPLSELSPRELGADFLGVMHLKGREPLRALHETLGPERWKDLTQALLRDHAGGAVLTWEGFRDAVLQRAPEAWRGALTELFDGWLGETALPGFVVTQAEVQRLPGQDEAWQVTAVVANRGTAAGPAKFRAGHGDDARSLLLVVEPGEELEVGLVTPKEPDRWTLEAFLALNRSAPTGSLAKKEGQRADPALEGTRPAEVLGAAAPVVIDNQDEGFTVTLEDGTQVAWDQRTDGEPALPQLPAFGIFRQPSKWSRWRSGGQWYRPYGLFDVTAAVKRATEDGQMPARWHSAVPEPGRYRVEVYLPPNDGPVGRRVTESWHFKVRGAEPARDVVIERDASRTGWNDLGRFQFDVEAEVTLLDQGDGIVVADAVRFVKEES